MFLVAILLIVEIVDAAYINSSIVANTTLASKIDTQAIFFNIGIACAALAVVILFLAICVWCCVDYYCYQ